MNNGYQDPMKFTVPWIWWHIKMCDFYNVTLCRCASSSFWTPWPWRCKHNDLSTCNDLHSIFEKTWI